MKLIVRNLACPCCVIVVRQLCEQQQLPLKHISYGQIEFGEMVSDESLEKLAASFREIGLEIISDPRKKMVEQVKALILAKVHEASIEQGFVLSSYLKKNTLKDYSTLTKLFSANEGKTIEQYYVQLKMEKAKQLLGYGSLSVKEVAACLGYSNSQHFAVQFRKAFNITPSEALMLSVGLKNDDSKVTNKLSILANTQDEIKYVV